MKDGWCLRGSKKYAAKTDSCALPFTANYDILFRANFVGAPGVGDVICNRDKAKGANMCLNTRILLLLVSASIFAGCAHNLQIRNLDAYRNTSLACLQKPVNLGVRVKSPEMEGRRFVKEVAESLLKYNVNATTAVMNDHSGLDAIATISVVSEYNGSGWNFLINWPGYLIFAPAWHGYNYEIKHNFTVLITDAKSEAVINSFILPVSLNIQHAAMNRTWTEVGWLEVGIIPLIGGIIFIDYDDNVTPIAHDKARPVIADYIAQEIADSLQPLSRGKTSRNVGTEQMGK